MQYEWWHGARDYLAQAGVETWEVMEVLYSSRRWPRPARTREDLPVLTVWGRTEDGKPIVVMLRRIPSEPDIRQIVMAAPMGPRQLKEFTAWEEAQQ